MRRLAILILLLSAPGCYGVTMEYAGHDGEETVRETERARLDALLANDFPTLERILGDDLTYTHTTGSVEDKEEFIGMLKSGRLQYRAFAPRDVTVRSYDGTAVLTGLADVHVALDDQNLAFTMRFTSVYVYRAGRYQMVAWQSTRLP
jgi:hypothetical protein